MIFFLNFSWDFEINSKTTISLDQIWIFLEILNTLICCSFRILTFELNTKVWHFSIFWTQWLVISLVEILFSRNFYQWFVSLVRVNFSPLKAVHCGKVCMYAITVFGKINVYTKEKLLESWFHEFFLSLIVFYSTFSHVFDKKFVKVTVLLNKLLNSWFDEIFY